MKVRISYTVEVSDDYRRAIRRFYGKEGLATREEVQDWHEAHGASLDDDLMWDYGEDGKDDDNDKEVAR